MNECETFFEERDQYLDTPMPAGMFYILDENKNPVESRDGRVMVEWFNEGRKKRGIRHTRIKVRGYHYRISTVFLCLDHIGGMFESMVFCDNDDDAPGTGEPYRYHTYAEAVKGHKRLYRFVKQHKILKGDYCG